MRFYKITKDEIVLSISTVNVSGEGNITEEEYMQLKQLFTEMPNGKALHDNGDGTYTYIDKEPEPEPDVEPEEALEILLGGAT